MSSPGVDSVGRNTRSIVLIQAANIVLPLLLIPYLTRSLGLETYGVVAYGLALVQVATIVTDFGFSVSVPHAIATQRSDTHAVRRLAGAVLAAKVPLLCVTIAIYATLVMANPQFREHATFFWWLGLSIVFVAFQPTWFYQGMERMRYITYYTVVARVAYVGAALMLVKSEGDLVWLGVVYSASFALSTGLGLAFMFRQGFVPVLASAATTWVTLRESAPFFGARAAVALYSSGATVFLGLVGTTTQVAVYGLANQIYRSATALQSAAVMAFYPYMARTKDFGRLFRVMRWSTLGFAGLWLMGLPLAPHLIPGVFGRDFVGAVLPTMLLLAAFVVTVPSTYLGYPALGAGGRLDLANRSAYIAGGVQMGLLAALALSGETSTARLAVTVIVVETLVCALRALWVRRMLRGDQEPEEAR